MNELGSGIARARLAAAGTLVLILSCSLAAQSPYVGATFNAEIFRVSNVNSDPSGNSESYAGAIRVGTPLGERWGVEFEFARSRRAEATTPPAFFELPGIMNEPLPIPGFTATRQVTTFSPTVWRSQRVSTRASLVYYGGVAFTRVHRTLEELDDPRLAGFVGYTPVSHEMTIHAADAAVGVETRVAMTDQLRFTAGVRMQTAVGSLAIRPGAGVLWEF